MNEQKQIMLTEKTNTVVERTTRHILYQDTIGSLCATDYKWVQQEQVMQGKLIIEYDGNHSLS